MPSSYHLNELFKDLDLSKDPTSVLGNKLVFSSKMHGYNIEIKSFSISEHARILHRWCNMHYTKRFWGMETSFLEFVKTCIKKARSFKEMQYLLFLNNVPVACFEVYIVLSDILAKYYDCGIEDYGIHLLMAPYRETIQALGFLEKDFSERMLNIILYFLFTKTSAINVMAEPDKENGNACRLAERTGFKFLKEIALPEKFARLYCLNKEEFLSQQPVCPSTTD